MILFCSGNCAVFGADSSAITAKQSAGDTRLTSMTEESQRDWTQESQAASPYTMSSFQASNPAIFQKTQRLLLISNHGEMCGDLEITSNNLAVEAAGQSGLKRNTEKHARGQWVTR